MSEDPAMGHLFQIRDNLELTVKKSNDYKAKNVEPASEIRQRERKREIRPTSLYSGEILEHLKTSDDNGNSTENMRILNEMSEVGDDGIRRLKEEERYNSYESEYWTK